MAYQTTRPTRLEKYEEFGAKICGWAFVTMGICAAAIFFLIIIIAFVLGVKALLASLL